MGLVDNILMLQKQWMKNFRTIVNQFKVSDFLNLREHDINQKLGVDYPDEFWSFDFGYQVITWVDDNSKLECSFRDCVCTDAVIWLKQADQLTKIGSATVEKEKNNY